MATSSPPTHVAVRCVCTVDRLLAAIAGGDGVPADLFSVDALLDATVPGWRFTVRGRAAIAGQYRGWFAHSATFEELERLPFDGGEVLAYLLTWSERGVPHAAHHCHVLHFDAVGRIAGDRFFSGGRWNAGLLAMMAGADDGD